MSRRDRDERGATVVIVALLATFLLVLSGFTVDFGQAFMSKRNLQKAADAGALAAAQALTKYPGTCSNVLSNSTAIAEAQAAAQKYLAENRESYLPASTQTEFSVVCDPQLKVLVVSLGVEGDTPSLFGPLAGGSDSITTNRRAEATVDVAPGVKEGVRPLAICSAALPGTTATNSFVQVFYPGGGHAPPSQCPVPKTPGNWWTLDCPGERTGSTGALEDQIRNGCPDAVSVIPGQADDLSAGELTVVLEDACPSAPMLSEECMSGDPGNLDAGHIASAWHDLVVSQDESFFPVFCAPPQCSESTTSGTGTNAVFPVYKLVAAVVCGYHFSKTEKFHSTTGECAGNPYLASADPDDSTGNNYLVLKYIRARASGSNQESECALGAECDGGLRRTRLTR